MMTSVQNVGVGWHPLIQELETKLNELDPEFTLQQVKEKFGGLRYYASCKSEVFTEFHRLIQEAEGKSFGICEECGDPGEPNSGRFGWMKTLCGVHQRLREERENSMI